MTNDAVQRDITVFKSKLLSARNERPKPHLDDKIIVSWNGLMISALSHASCALNDPSLATTAIQCANFIRMNMYVDKILRRGFRDGVSSIEGVADDYAFLIKGTK